MTDPSPTSNVLQTKGERLLVPPAVLVATGHEETVYLWLTHIGDRAATSSVLNDLITIRELHNVTVRFAATGGLIAKPLGIDEAARVREQLENIGSQVTLVRPDEAEAHFKS